MFDKHVFKMNTLPSITHPMECYPIEDILQENNDLKDFYLPEKVLKKYVKVVDVCYKNSRRSCCFTKGYGRYVEGTGSVFTNLDENQANNIFKQLETLDEDSLDYFHLVKNLQLRYFTPKEICRLMYFPETYSFPDNITNKQKYMVLGNSINVKIVSELIKLL